MANLNLNLLLADLSVLQKTGDITIERKVNTYSITKGGTVFTFTCGSLTENIAFDFKVNGQKLPVITINEFLSAIDNVSAEQKKAWPMPENDLEIEEAPVKKSRPVQKSFDLNGAAANFAQAILAQQADSESVNEKIQNLQNQIDSFQMPRPLEIKINDLPEIKLEQNSCAILEDLLRAAYTRQNAYIFGPAGCGKTTAAKQVAKAMGLNFGYICLTAGASETWLFGRNTPNGFIEGEFSKIYKNGGVFLADEMDAADSNLLIALNTAIDSNQLLNPMSGELIQKHKDFIFIGAGNTNGLGATGNYNGRSRLDASTLSRFVFFEMDYDEKIEASLCLDKNIFNALIATRKYLQNRKSENFITTRDFIKLSKMLTAGSTYDFCVKSLTCNFSEVEKNEVKKFWQFKTPKKQKVITQDEIPF